MINIPKGRYDAVYFVEAPPGTLFNPFAIRPEVLANNEVCWLDTSRGITLPYTSITAPDAMKDAPPEKIDITTQDGAHIILRKLTLTIYKQLVHDGKIMNPPLLHSDEEVQQFYLNSIFEPY